MTMLRRTAQLVADLRTLNVIKGSDGINVSLDNDGWVSMEISLQALNFGKDVGSSPTKTIKNALVKEFGESRILTFIEKSDKIICLISSH